MTGDESSTLTLRAFTPTITPFTAGHDIDEPAFRRHLGRLRSQGIGVYVGGPGSGEGNTLSRAEMDRLLRIAVEELGGVVPVRAMGVEPRTIDQMVAFMNLAADAGTDASYVYSLDMGHGIRPTTAELEDYLTRVLSVSRLPAVLSVHDAAHYLYPIDVLERIVDRFPVAGLSVATTNFTYLSELIARLAGVVEVTVGNVPFTVPGALLGAQAMVLTEGNVAPRLVASLVRELNEGDLERARLSYRKLARLSACLAAAGGQRSVKAVMHATGRDSGRVRPPRLPLDPEAMLRLARSVEDMDCLADEAD